MRAPFPLRPRTAGTASFSRRLLPWLLPFLLAACSNSTIEPYPNPTASAGPDRRASLGSLVVMDGTGSRDPQGEPLRYEWTLAAPFGSTAVLDNNRSPKPVFTADKEGTYTLRLTVWDISNNPSPMDMAVVTALPNASRLPDTGQETCYDARGPILFPPLGVGQPFAGEDGQYVTNPMRLLDNSAVAGEGTVHDNVTGLDWQGGDNTTAFNWFQATGTIHGTLNPGGGTNVCGDLSARSFGGFTDWRLPTRLELATLLNLDGRSPALDNARFPGAAAALYWTSSGTAPVVPATGWAVDFDNGAVTEKFLSDPYRVRCVRGAERRSVVVPDITNGTAVDTTTGLVWQVSNLPAAKNWQDALAYCEQTLALAGGGWRLPNAKELGSLIYLGLDNATGTIPMIDTNLQPAPGAFWTSTSRVRGGVADNAWTVDFTTGKVGDTPKGIPTYVRCVR